MNILLIRHAHAEDRKVWNTEGYPDSFRPLTNKGKRKFHDAAKNISKMLKSIDCIYTSQFTRAIETAEILKTFYEKADLEIISSLNPGADLTENEGLFENFSNDQTIAFIGHQPDIGDWASNLLNHKTDSLIRFKKGGAAYISYFHSKGQLQWLLTCNQLAALNW